MHNPHKLITDSNRNTKIINITNENANLCGKKICDMCTLLKYAKNTATCEICGNHIKLTCLARKLTCLVGSGCMWAVGSWVSN